MSLFENVNFNGKHLYPFNKLYDFELYHIERLNFFEILTSSILGKLDCAAFEICNIYGLRTEKYEL